MNRVFVDGVEGAQLPADDPGLLLGWTAFDTLRTYGEVPFRLDAHLDRLLESADRMAIPLPPRAQVEREIRAAISPDVWIRYTLTGGGRRVIVVGPVDPASLSAPIEGASLEWDPPEFLPGVVKHGSRAAWEVTARRRGVEQVLLISSQGHILESSRANVMAVVDGVICTPPLDGRQLTGVTRTALLEASANAGLPLEERPLLASEPFDELYLTATVREVAPVVRWDDAPGPGGGPVGDRLRDAFRHLVEAETGERITLVGAAA